MTVDAQAASDLHRIGVGLNKGGWAHHDFKGSDIDQWHDPNDCRICAAKDALCALAARLEAAENAQGASDDGAKFSVVPKATVPGGAGETRPSPVSPKERVDAAGGAE